MSHSDFYSGKAAAYRKVLVYLQDARYVRDNPEGLKRDIADLLAEALNNKASEEGEE